MNLDTKQQRRQIMAEIHKLELLQESGVAVDESKFTELGRRLAALNPREEVKRRGRREDALITKELVQYAKECGTKQGTLYYRVYNLGMDPIEAAEKPARRKRKTVRWEESGLTVEKYLFRKQQDILDQDIMEEFNISQTAVNQFKKKHHLSEIDIRNMEQPKAYQSGYVVKYDEFGKRIYPPGVFDLAASHNVSKQTFFSRVHMGWNYEKAATHPVRKINRNRRKA